MLICAALLGPPVSPPAAVELFFTALVSAGAFGGLDGPPVGAAVGAAPPPKSAATWESTLAGASPSSDDVMRSEAASEAEFLLAWLR